MKDLIEKTNSVAKLAGQTEIAHARRAGHFSRISFLLSWTVIIATASLGAAYFAPYQFSDPLYAALTAIAAAFLGLLIRVSRITCRSGEHRTAQLLFRRIRYDADMLLLKIRGGDISRAETITHIEALSASLCDLLSRTVSVSDKKIKRAGRAFDRRHPEYREILTLQDTSEFIRVAAPKTGAGRT